MVSLVTEPIPGKYLHRLTFWTRHSTEVRLELDKLGEEHEEDYKVWTYLKNIMENIYLIAFLPAFQKEPNYGTTAEVAREPREVPSWRKVINFLCGIGSSGGDRRVIFVKLRLCA